MNERLEIRSPHPPEECARLIAAAIDSERRALFSFLMIFHVSPVIGGVSNTDIRLRKRIGHQHFSQTLLTARLEPDRSGALLRGEFVTHPVTRNITRIWFGAATVVGVVSFVSGLADELVRPTSGERSWTFLLIPAGIVMICFMIDRLGRHFARKESEFLTHFLCHTLDASDD